MFGKELKKRRRAVRMTQIELGRKLGCGGGNSRISLMESGQKVPTEEEMDVLRQLFPGISEPAATNKENTASTQMEPDLDELLGQLYITVVDLMKNRARRLLKFVLARLSTRS